MFMKFTTCDNNGTANNTGKICINMKIVDMVSQAGEWRQEAIPTEDDGQDDFTFIQAGIMQDPFAMPVVTPRPARRQGAARPTRRQDVFVINPQVCILHTMNQAHTVLADFDELSKMLESLHEMME